jgi:PKD repeat protein
MKGTKGQQNWWLGLLLALICIPSAKAVLFEATGDPSYNTNAPTGSLANSGWQYEGQWNTENGPFLGTPIAPTFFLAAQHVGGTANLNNDQFVFSGVTYTVVTNFDDPSTDLRIWQVGQTFPSYAPLYTASSEVGKTCVVLGRGYDRGAAVIVGGVTNGWQWGNTVGVQRWGENTVSSIYTYSGYGQHLLAYFDRNGITNECMLTAYDSSGGVFIQDGSTWKLAAINHAISDPFVSTNGVNGSGFNAAVVDYGGLYLGGDNNWQLTTNQLSDIPAYFLSTRVSARISWINSVLNAAPTAIFSDSPTNGAAPLTVTFDDSSTGPITNRFWSFGDGGTASFSVATNPTHTYSNPGSYSVTLVVSGTGGSSTNTVANLISVYAPFAWWQLNYFGSTNNADAASDVDLYGTGMSNTNKFLAGFNPTNAAAYLHIISVATSNADVIVTYLGANGDTNYVPGVQSRTNVLEYTAGAGNGNYTSTNFASTGQTNILGGGTGLGTVTNMTDPGGATNNPSRYYRVRVLP